MLISRNYLKNSNTILKRNEFLDLNFGKIVNNFFKIVMESWPKLEQVSKKVPTPRTLELTAFDK